MFLVVEIFVGILFVFACVNLRNSKSSQNSVKLHGNTIDDDEIPVNCSTPIKRRHSHEEKSVYLSDNHIEEIKVSKRRCSLDRKFFLNTTTWKYLIFASSKNHFFGDFWLVHSSKHPIRILQNLRNIMAKIWFFYDFSSFWIDHQIKEIIVSKHECYLDRMTCFIWRG